MTRYASFYITIIIFFVTATGLSVKAQNKQADYIAGFKVGQTLITDTRDIIHVGTTAVGNDNVSLYESVLAKEIIPIEVTYRSIGEGEDRVKDPLEFINDHRFLEVSKYESDDRQVFNNVKCIFKDNKLISFRAATSTPVSFYTKMYGSPDIYMIKRTPDCATVSSGVQDTFATYIWAHGAVKLKYIWKHSFDKDCKEQVTASVTSEDTIATNSYFTSLQKIKDNTYMDGVGEFRVNETKFTDLKRILGMDVQRRECEKVSILWTIELPEGTPIEVVSGKGIVSDLQEVRNVELVKGYRIVLLSRYVCGGDTLKSIKMIFNGDILISFEAHVTPGFHNSVSALYGNGELLSKDVGTGSCDRKHDNIEEYYWQNDENIIPRFSILTYYDKECKEKKRFVYYVMNLKQITTYLSKIKRK